MKQRNKFRLFPCFRCLFGYDSAKESQANRVQIIDVDVEVLEMLVRYIYTGNVDNFERYASDLLVVADKYQIDCLKSICEERLLSEISVQSVSDLIILADMYPATDLFNECLDYITYNSTRVMASNGWKKILARADFMSQLCARLHSKYSELMIVDYNGRNIIDSNENTGRNNRTDWISRAEKMFSTAHKYKMANFKSIFKQKLASEVTTVESVSDLFILADMHQITELSTKCHQQWHIGDGFGAVEEEDCCEGGLVG